jgi:tryptophan-rich sensory protein
MQSSSDHRRYQWSVLLLSLVVTGAAASLGAIASIDAANFYATLDKPAWAPPPGIFGPVWTVLYVLMAVAAWLVWRTAGFRAARIPLALYVVQLALNALWTWLFFRWHSGRWAFFEINALWLVLLFTFVSFWRTHRLAGRLLVPYWAWITFAAALTYAVWQRNPGVI